MEKVQNTLKHDEFKSLKCEIVSSAKNAKSSYENKYRLFGFVKGNCLLC